MNVDLPAPLSPSTQVTWPARTAVEMSQSEMTLPKVLQRPRISSSGVSVWFSAMSGYLLDNSAKRRTYWLASTASSSMTPRKNLNQSASQPA